MRSVAWLVPILFLSGIVIVTGIKSSSALEQGQKNSTTNMAVCTSLSSSCNRSYKSFAPYELGLVLPQRIKPNTTYESVTFYAVVLKMAPAGSESSCDQGEFSSGWENERKRVQALFSQKKVFADHQCPDMGAVSYIISGKPNTRPFIAIYGGTTSNQASPVLAKMKGRYKTATIKPMRVAFEQIMQ